MLSSAILLFLIMDPFGNIPLFVAALKDVEPRRRTIILIRENLIALGVLLVFLFTGRHLLNALHISESALAIAGGIVLFLIALRMVFPNRAHPVFDDDLSGEPFIVPLAIPMIAGPSALAAVLLIGSGNPDNWPAWIAAVFIAWLAAATVLIIGARLANFLGKRGLIAMERLMGMILVAISVEMFLGGLDTWMTANQ